MFHIFVNIAKQGVANIIVCRMRNLTNMLHFGVVAMVVVEGNELGKYRRRQICTKRNPDKIPGKILLFHRKTNCGAFLSKNDISSILTRTSEVAFR